MLEFNIQVRIAEIAAISIVLISTLHGYRIGLIKTLFRMVSTVLAILISLLLVPVVIVVIPQSVYARYGIAYMVSFLAAGILLGIVGHILGVINHIPVLKQINRMAGALTGIAFGIILLWLVLILLGVFHTTEWCATIISLVKGSRLLLFIHERNPLLEVLNMLSFPTI